MNPSIEIAIHRLASRGWQCSFNADLQFPADVSKRYPWLPDLVKEAAAAIQEAVHPEETLWLLTAADYSHQTESQFAWNEWEIISLDAAGSNMEWATEIRDFWDTHFPLALSVGNGYGYYALTQDGGVISGEGPDFQGTSPFADSYLEFLAKIAELD